MGGGRRELEVASSCCAVAALLLLLLMETSTGFTSFPGGVGIESSEREPSFAEGARRMRGGASGAAAKGTMRKAAAEVEGGGGDVMTTAEPGSHPPRCTAKCGRCRPCRAVHVAVPPGRTPVTEEYYPEAWRCKCGDRLYGP